MRVTTPKQRKEKYVNKQLLCIYAVISCRAYLVNDMHYAILRYDVRLYNLSPIDIVYAITDSDDECFALLCR